MFQYQFVITEQCNLACNYCYMNNRKSMMSFETFSNALSFIDKKIKSKMILDNNNGKKSFALFGGEPLLNFNLIKEISDSNLENNQIHFPTNGILLNEEKCKFLNKNNIGYGISFDGPYGNNKNRILFNTNESSVNKYNDFHFNIMKTRGCKVMLHPNIFPYLIETYLYFLNLEIFNSDFTLVRDDIYTEKDIQIYKENLHNLTTLVIEQINNSKNNFISIPGVLLLYLLDTLIFNKTKKKRPFGCFAGTHGLGILPNGKIYPCARFASHDKLIFGDLNAGVIYKDNIEFISKNYKPQEFNKCKQCKLFNVCNAGCSYSQLKNGNWNSMEPIDSVCELLKISYRESYRLYNKCKNNKKFTDFLEHRVNQN